MGNKKEKPRRKCEGWGRACMHCGKIEQLEEVRVSRNRNQRIKAKVGVKKRKEKVRDNGDGEDVKLGFWKMTGIWRELIHQLK